METIRELLAECPTPNGVVVLYKIAVTPPHYEDPGDLTTEYATWILERPPHDERNYFVTINAAIRDFADRILENTPKGDK